MTQKNKAKAVVSRRQIINWMAEKHKKMSCNLSDHPRHC